jgi:hypothetical protein
MGLFDKVEGSDDLQMSADPLLLLHHCNNAVLYILISFYSPGYLMSKANLKVGL